MTAVTMLTHAGDFNLPLFVCNKRKYFYLDLLHLWSGRFATGKRHLAVQTFAEAYLTILTGTLWNMWHFSADQILLGTKMCNGIFLMFQLLLVYWQMTRTFSNA